MLRHNYIKVIYQAKEGERSYKLPRCILCGGTVYGCPRHATPILFMGIYYAIAGVGINWLGYMAIALPVVILIWVVMFLFIRYVVKPDMSKLEKLDFEKIEALRLGPMSKKEKFVVVVSAILVAVWILPGFLTVLAPQAAITAWMDSIIMLTHLLVVLILFSVIKFHGEPILNIAETCGKINWMVIMLLAGIMLIASAMGEDTTGIAAWVMEKVSPLVQGMSPFTMVALMYTLSVILTNIANNIPVGIVLITIGIPLSLQMGINSFVTATAVSISANLAFTIPPAFVPVGTCYAYPYGGGKHTLRWGIVASIVSIVITVLLICPLGSIFG